MNECEVTENICPETSTCHDLIEKYWCECPEGQQIDFDEQPQFFVQSMEGTYREHCEVIGMFPWF